MIHPRPEKTEAEKEKARIVAGKWYYANKARKFATNKAWKKKNPKKCAAHRSTWVAKNPEKEEEKQKRYYARHRTKILEYSKRYQGDHREQLRLKKSLKRRLRSPHREPDVRALVRNTSRIRERRLARLGAESSRASFKILGKTYGALFRLIFQRP